MADGSVPADTLRARIEARIEVLAGAARAFTRDMIVGTVAPGTNG